MERFWLWVMDSTGHRYYTGGRFWNWVHLYAIGRAAKHVYGGPANPRHGVGAQRGWFRPGSNGPETAQESTIPENPAQNTDLER